MGKTIRVTTTPATVLRHAVELAERREGEDMWEMQARTLEELGYRIVGKDSAVVELPEPDHIAGDIATFPGGHSISAGADPNAVKAWRQHAGVSAAIAAWGEREPRGGDPR